MKYLLSLLAILLNIGIASAQIEVTDSTSTDWGGGTDVDVTPGKPTGKVTSLSLSQNRLLLSGGQTAQLVAVINADAANKSVTWSVADNTIATVSANGLVTAITTGQTVVTATSVDGGLTAQCLVTVKNNAKVYVERITLDITEMEMYVGEVRAVTPTVYPDNATDKTLKWETRGVDYYNPALPDENHVFTAYKPGVIEMIIYPNDGSEAYAVCKITVKDRPLTKMTLPSEIVLNINEMKTLKPEVTPELFQKKYKWTVADPSVAYVTSSGRITGVKAGTTTVTATALDGTGVSATSKVTVTSTVASLGYSGWILERGEDIQPWTALCFHESGYYEKPAPDDSKGNKWYSPDYDDSSWYYAYGPLKHRVWPGGGERRTGYGQWEILDYSTMSIRQKFYLPDVSGYDFKVYARVYLSGEVYINGHRVYITDTGDHHRTGSFMAFIDPSYLVMGGENTIAIIGYPCGEEQYLDYGIHYETMIPVTRVVIKQKQLTMMIGATEKLEAVVKPAEASHQEVKWESSDSSVASVDEDGNVTAIGKGKASITATSVDGTNIVASCDVTVTTVEANITLNLAEGWNWISNPLDFPIAVGRLSSAKRILSQTEENFDDPQLGMVGNITGIVHGTAYKVEMKSQMSLILKDYAHDLVTSPITLKKGWNWISYPYYETRPLTGLVVNAEEGDYVVSQEGFASHSDGAWQGSLGQMTPGAGYLYKSVSDKVLQFDFNAKSAMGAAMYETATAKADMTEFTVDIHRYPSTLNVIAVLNGDGAEMPEDCQVYAFVGNECRGVGKNIGGKYFVTVYGDASATVKFLVKNIRTGQEYEAGETVTFREDVVGSVKEPMVLTMTPTAIRRIFDSSRTYKVYSAEGVMVKDGITADKFSALPRGIYIIDGHKVIIE
ncbi:MAG: Ig-like domain-containing protein [Prevotella sp.]